MLAKLKVDPRNEPLIQRALPLVDKLSPKDQFQKHLRTHRQGTRDRLPGIVYAGMLKDCSPGTRNVLYEEVRDWLLRNDLTQEQIEDTEFASAFDYVREKMLEENNGKSCNNDFWQACWGVYTSAMMRYANEKPVNNADTTYGDLFD